jgi:hypothetical protein
VSASYSARRSQKIDLHDDGSDSSGPIRLHSQRIPPKAPLFGRLIAWDPVQKKEAWHVDYKAPWNGGTLTTAGNLVFQGTADGYRV